MDKDHVSKNLKINALFSINHSDAKYYYIETSNAKDTIYVDLNDLIRKYDLWAEAVIPITIKEIIDMKLKILKNGDIKYTMQYRKPDIKLQIRTDDAHGFPHIDVERNGSPQEKIILNSKPEDYEASINTILRFVEKKINRHIGARYWLLPTLFSDIGNAVIQLFDLYQMEHNIKTTYTDIARFLCLNIIRDTSDDKKLEISDYSRMIDHNFRICKEQEDKNGDIPIESKSIQHINGIDMLPFPVIIPSTSRNKSMPLDADGNPINTMKIIPADIVIESND